MIDKPGLSWEDRNVKSKTHSTLLYLLVVEIVERKAENILQLEKRKSKFKKQQPAFLSPYLLRSQAYLLLVPHNTPCISHCSETVTFSTL